jgi:hypothetical protein
VATELPAYLQKTLRANIPIPTIDLANSRVTNQ